MFDWVWTFLQSEENRNIVAWLGTGVAAAAGAIWGVVKFFSSKKDKPSPAPITNTATGAFGGIAAGSNVTGNITQNYGLEASAVRREIAEPLSEQVLATMRAEFARARGVDPAKLVPLFERLGHRGLGLEEVRERADEAINGIIALSETLVLSSNEGRDIEATLRAARGKLAGLDTRGAVSLLADRIAEEEATRRERLIPLLREKAAIERISYDYDAAKRTLKRLVEVQPEEVWAWIELGDLFITTGSLGDAAQAFQSGVQAAQRSGDEHGLGAASDRLGTLQIMQGDLKSALRSYGTALQIAGQLVSPTRTIRIDNGISRLRTNTSGAYTRLAAISAGR